MREKEIKEEWKREKWKKMRELESMEERATAIKRRPVGCEETERLEPSSASA